MSSFSETRLPHFYRKETEMPKTIGIMGGMGPAATVDLMSRIISMGESCAPEMLASARRLEAAGADFIVIACHAAHCFVDEIKGQIGIPILEMPEETAKLLKLNGVDKAAVLATDGTVRSGLFGHALERMGILTVYPNEEQQKLVMSLVYDYVKKGVAEIPDTIREGMQNMIGDLGKQGAEVLILASTEFPIAFSLMGLKSDAFVDPTIILAKSAIRMAGANVRKSADDSF